MKPVLITLMLLLAIKPARADEGMWLPYLLGQKVYNDMVKKGLKLTKEQLYSINKASIKDAVIIFNGGCTAGVVSPQGLIFTNQHCSFYSIAGTGPAGQGYLKNGFFAHSKAEEVPIQELYVEFLVRVEDVTASVEDKLKDLNGSKKNEQQHIITTEIASAAIAGSDYNSRVLPMFNGNQYLLFVYKRYKDIRLVAVPPLSVGSFGAITDNWKWPRHAGDFSVFRIYADRGGKPAPYSPDNLPLKPKYFFPISLKNIRENEYTMILGYPANTNRYENSHALKLKIEEEDPFIVTLTDIKLKYLHDQMMSSPDMKLRLAPLYASLVNYRRFFDGESGQLQKYHALEQRQTQESSFRKWAQGTAYENILDRYEQLYKMWAPYARHRIYLSDGLRAASTINFAAGFQQLDRILKDSSSSASSVTAAVKMMDEARKNFASRENVTGDREILATTCHAFYANIPPEQRPAGFYETIERRYGNPDQDSTYLHWAADLIDNTIILNDQKWKDFMENPTAGALHNDPAFKYYNTFVDNYVAKCADKEQAFSTENNDLRYKYLKGLMAMQPDKDWYPDANTSLRLSYGQVKSYEPHDAVKYNYICTMKGVLEKYKSNDIEFDLSEKYIHLYRMKDFGRYKDTLYNDIVTCFITTNDITGGNSGSPVLNGKGELIGLLFDGNYEGLGHKARFYPSFNRAVCVDVHYILWCIDKLGGASNIIDEFKLVN